MISYLFHRYLDHCTVFSGTEGFGQSMHFSFLTSHLNTGLCLNCVSSKSISGLTKEKLILVLWITHCAQKLTTSFNYTNNQVTEKVIQFITNLIAFWDWKKKVITERTHPNGRGPKGINGRQPGLQVDTKGCSSGASEAGSEEKGLLSTTTTEKLRLWDDGVITPVSGQGKVPSQITAVHPILLKIMKKIPIWLLCLTNLEK